MVKIKPKKQLIVSTGVMTQVAMEAAEKINRDKKHGCGVIHLGTIKPLDEKILKKYFKTVDKILTLEEGVENGGFGSAILESTNKLMPENCHKIKILGLKNKFEEMNILKLILELVPNAGFNKFTDAYNLKHL